MNALTLPQLSQCKYALQLLGCIMLALFAAICVTSLVTVNTDAFQAQYNIVAQSNMTEAQKTLWLNETGPMLIVLPNAVKGMVMLFGLTALTATVVSLAYVALRIKEYAERSAPPQT